MPRCTIWSDCNREEASFAARMRKMVAAGLMVCAGLASAAQAAAVVTPKGYQQTNLISNGAVDAAVVDQNFVDPWGFSIGQDFWINTTVTGLDYITNAQGAIAFSVSIPPASGSGKGLPTGTVFSGNVPAGTFLLPDKSSPAFLFCTLDGTVSGWSGSAVQITVNNRKLGAVYTDMALATNAKGTFILLANFGKGAGVEVYNGNYKRAMVGAFTDPKVPAGYAPYAVHVLAGTVYVTYAERKTPSYEEVLGAGHGFVDAFNLNGKFLARAIPTGGKLNAPWGMAIAPDTFGQFGGDVLVGNFGDGVINAYDPNTWAYKGRIADANGNVIANPGLWEIAFGQVDPAVGDPNTLYFTAGLEDETAGLFGAITVASAKVSKTKTSVTSDSNPGSTGQKITFTALVQPGTGTGEPQGKVAFTLDGKALATSVVDSTAHATASVKTLAVGKHRVVATYLGDANFKTSAGALLETVTTPTVAPPIFTPAAGSYTAAQTVTITDPTAHAVIHYTVDGTKPTASSPVYSKAISLTKTTTVKAIGILTGWTSSAVSSSAYTINTSATALPTFSPGGGTFYSTQLVTLKDTTAGAAIYYTTDGSTPTSSSSLYKTAISVSKNMTIKAMAAAPGLTASPVASATYTISTYGYTAPPTFSPGGGSFTAAQSVSVGDTSKGAVIYYTTDGTTPTTSSAVYNKALAVAYTTTVKAIAVAPGMQPSSVVSSGYTISGGDGW